MLLLVLGRQRLGTVETLRKKTIHSLLLWYPTRARVRAEASVFEVLPELMMLYPSLDVRCPLSYIRTQTGIGGECGLVTITGGHS